MKTGRVSRRQAVMTALTLLWIGCIYANSLMTSVQSSAQSGAVLQWLQGMLNALSIPLTLTSHMVRKLAHFVEYALLGALLKETLRAYTAERWPHGFIILFVGLLVPVTDETLQLFVEGRAGMVQDVVLDFSGVLTGMAVMILIAAVHRRLLCRRKPVVPTKGAKN